MNLDLSLLGWAHSYACLAAMILGPLSYFQRKGSPPHRGFGRAYLVVMLGVNLTAFGIYRRHMFWFPHWFAVAALASIGIAFIAARFHWPRAGWMRLHFTAMLTSYYVLIGGGVNEVFLRVDAIRRIAFPAHTEIVAIAHLSVIAAFVALIIAENVRRSPRRPRTLAAPPSPTTA
jgi:uncharacterized membrane protein